MTSFTRRTGLAGLAASTILAGAGAWAAEPEPRVIEAPIEVFRNKLLVTAVINGRELTAVYDSGATHTLLSAPAAETLGIATPGRGGATGFGGSRAARVTRNLSLELGGVQQRVAEVLVVDLSPLTEQFGRRLDMILGVDIYPGHVVEIDVEAARLRFTPRAAFAPASNAVVVALNEQSRNFTTEIEVNGVSVRANFDLGAGDALTIGPALAGRLGLDYRTLPKTQKTGVGGNFDVGLTSVDAVRVAGETFSDVPIHVSDVALPVGEANLGFDILSRFKIAIDYQGRQAWLAPTERRLVLPFQRDLAGLRVSRPSQDSLAIVHVTVGGPAHGAGLAAGDRIAAIDNTPIAAWAEGTDITLWTQRAGAVAITLADGRELTATLARFY